MENKFMVTRGEICGEMGEIDKGDWEYTYHDEHWVMYTIVESLYCTPVPNMGLYVNYTWIKIKKKNKMGNLRGKQEPKPTFAWGHLKFPGGSEFLISWPPNPGDRR